MKGYTLTELIICLAIIGALAALSAPAANRFVQKQRVTSATHQVLSLMYLARSEALTRGPVMLCDGLRDCEAFSTTNRLTLHTVTPDGSHQDPFTTLTLPDGVTLRWRRFRGVSLIFQRDGRTHYQNGHFFVCNAFAARKIIMSWSSHARVERVEPDKSC